ncbi:GNAT family N-acetyltransferase [Vibrio sp. JPW-9-11-11]|uniref:GNAT family N-acetyltransferase n=1 Tax=Vibrio sp. JPW-9-11-11 TaxID=1416532 RepID=UPI001594C39D|nr:GNAT family N-acetyltransferase [Vibrio sp. JPW-9-11-11]NVD07852.1 GNAT family N-acetyltransferase [Vibrio sp. JPW-9-11-11]
MKLALLNLKDAAELLKFEAENREWFDRFIPPREIGFYTLTGVKQHIREFLLDYHCSEMLPLLIKSDQDEIIGRLNLTNIDTNRRTAHLGYRVGQSSVNQGVAKWAVAQMPEMLKRYGIEQLYAYAQTSNLASQNVLLASGFVYTKRVANFAELHGKPIDCLEYRLEVGV